MGYSVVSGAVVVVDVAVVVVVVSGAVAIITLTVFALDISGAAAAGVPCVIVVVVAAIVSGVYIWATEVVGVGDI